MPTVAKDVIYALARLMDANTPVIPLQFMPSLTTLAKKAGWSRRHVERALNYLELVGAVTRVRPTQHDAQTKHARTSYTVHHHQLLRLGTGSPKDSRDAQALGLGPPRRPPRAKKSPDLGTPSQAAEDTVAHSQTLSSNPPNQPDRTARFVQQFFAGRFGRSVDEDWAAKTAAEILSRPGAAGKDPLAYVRRTLATDRHPEKWLPTPQPPPFKKEEDR